MFQGTRVPVRSLFEDLEDGATVEQLLDWFPGVSRNQVESVLEFAAASLDIEPGRMKILCDQGTPGPLRTHLSNHTVGNAHAIPPSI